MGRRLITGLVAKKRDAEGRVSLKKIVPVCVDRIIGMYVFMIVNQQFI